ncbi:MAG TPA: ATP-binding protein [Lacipirellulaceae bacterium]|nr:ATP-binding protein [Lacipirellulaceae bacterium]
MSYRTFKRVLGETSLERKCRWWFGLSLVVLLTISFTWYGRRTDKLVDDRIKTLSEELWRAGWQKLHLENLAEYEKLLSEVGEPAAPADQSDKDPSIYERLAASSKELGRDFDWHALLPPTAKLQPGYRPEVYFPDEEERRLIEQYGWFNGTAVPENAPEGWKPRKSFSRSNRIDGRQVYQYYQPMVASASCVQCHRFLGAAPNPALQKDDVMAVVRVTINDQETVDALVKNRAILWAVAIAVGFLSMFSLWAVVRYVIVKPVTHLRDVANAVREGDVEQRAVIRTGDEFEELAAAFNRMLRQLLSQQSELRHVNDELDDRLDDLAQANMKLYEMNRLKSDFLATVSHELRTPLNSILGFSDVLSGIDSLDDKQKRYVGNIQRSGRMLLEMINDILDLAKMESGKMEVRLSEFKISALVSAQCDMARPLAEKKNIDLDCGASPSLPPLRQDQAKVQQILNNLLSNAIKFTPDGGRIMVGAQRDDQGDLRLTVADTGIGISVDDQQLVFEKFRQATAALPDGDAMTREYSGTGLGLSIVRELCRLLGGDVSLESELGKGSTFTVRLPWRLEEMPRLDTQLREDLEVLTRTAPVIAAPAETIAGVQSQGSGV